MPAEIVVIGGGLHGCSAALHLASEGYKVTVLEKDYVGRHASGVNAGGVRRLGRHPAEIPMSMLAWERWNRMKEIVGDDCGFRPVGQVMVAENDTDLELLQERENLIKSMGFNHEMMISKNRLNKMIPDVAPSCSGALLCEGDGYANPYQTVIAWKCEAEKRGAVFCERESVQDIDKKSSGWCVATNLKTYEADIVINCSGAWASEICDKIEEPVPVSPESLMLMVTERLSKFLTPVVSATSRPLSFKQFENGTTVIGGGIKGRFDTELQVAETQLTGLADNADTVVSLFPFMDKVKIVRAWAGVEGCLPDNIPVLGPSNKHDDFYHAFGFSAHGYQLSPITGEILVDLIKGKESRVSISSFSISRFSGSASYSQPEYNESSFLAKVPTGDI
ncbi:NAD(P)/FAD-dependent oxidoreductase [Aidingimonas lacisalsi]|uniref:NAD(P)/FAD-dependent oxidoreductase n=1 Tax=Aidingimonas lacisalsi TaxID=2604086 RepID=UPI0011D295CD|nr:FAD-dependent oxidoreductase [Aidingimonas lacisalsi]